MLVVIGPSGGGKSSAVRELATAGLVRVLPTWTTRPARVDESGTCLEHEFVDDAEFDRLDTAGFFLGTVEMFGLGYRYGLPDPRDRPPDAGSPVDVVMLRAPLLGELARHVPEFVTYQISASPAVAEPRLHRRGLSDEEVAARISDNLVETALGAELADRCFTSDGDLGCLVDDLSAALRIDFDL
jgi:ribose 1,5-bisphosphokinase PhnN